MNEVIIGAGGLLLLGSLCMNVIQVRKNRLLRSHITRCIGPLDRALGLLRDGSNE